MACNALDSVACIIVNFNAGGILEECVHSCLKSEKKLNIIVVDNASTDSSLEFIDHLPNDASVRVIKNQRNLGFSAAVNQGISEAGSESILILNPDCLLQPDALNKVSDMLNGDEHVGMVGPLLLNPDGTEQAGGRRAVPTPWRSFVRAFGLARFSSRWPKLYQDFYLHKQPMPEKAIEVEAISGACMLVKKRVIEDVGFMDEDYFMHCEDLDWCMRIRQNMWKILFVPDAVVVHHQGSCSRSRPFFVEWHKHKGMVRFYGKFFRHQYPGMLMWLVILGVWLRFGAVTVYYTIKRLRDTLNAGSG